MELARKLRNERNKQRSNFPELDTTGTPVTIYSEDSFYKKLKNLLTEAQMAIFIVFFPNFEYKFENDERCCGVWTTHKICAGSQPTAIFSKQNPFQVLQLLRTVQKHDCWVNCLYVWVRVKLFVLSVCVLPCDGVATCPGLTPPRL